MLPEQEPRTERLSGICLACETARFKTSPSYPRFVFGFSIERRFTGDVKMSETKTLLEQYVRDGSEAAFRELVQRYFGLVYATAMRLVVGDTQLAQDVTQTVFIHLARKAHTLRGEVSLGGWLHRDTRHVAATLMRSERRRRAREKQATVMNALQDHTADNLAQLAPVLDEAIAQLEKADRQAIMLRFFERNDFRAVGQALGSNEDAARMRVNRALERLQEILKRQGLAISTAALGAALSCEALTAAPAGLASAVAVTALAGATAGEGLAFKLLILMSQAKLKLALVALLLVLGTTSVGLLVRRSSQPIQPSASHSAFETTSRPVSKSANAVLTSARQPNRSRISPEVRDARANLWRALHEEPIDADGYVSTHKVIAALKAFGPDLSLAVPTLLDGLVSSNSEVQMCSLWGFSYVGKLAEDAGLYLLNLARSEMEPQHIRTGAIDALGSLALEPRTWQTPAESAFLAAAVPDLVGLLQSKDIELRTHAARVLGSLGSCANDAVPALTELLTYSATPEEGRGAAERVSGDDRLDETVVKDRMTTSTQRVKSSAAEALGHLGPQAEAAIPQLTTLLGDSDKEVRVRAAVALWRISGHTDGVQVLAENVSSKFMDPTWHQQLEVLGEMGPTAKAAIPALQYLCRFANPEIREPALTTLSKIAPEMAASQRSPGTAP